MVRWLGVSALAALSLATALTACNLETVEPDEEPSRREGSENPPPASPLPAADDVDFVAEPRDVPIAEIEVGPLASIFFFSWEDRSAGYLIEVAAAGANIPEDELEGLSVAEVFWAMSEAGTSIPEPLLAHHDALAVGGERPSWDLITSESAQGWARDRPRTRALPECNNATFQSSHCAVSAPWTASHCALDGNGEYSTDAYGPGTHGTRRFHAAMCLDGGGEVLDNLRWVSECPGFIGLGVIWVGYFGSPAYVAFTWIAPSYIGQARRWRHSGVVSALPGHRDWASKFGADELCWSF